MKLDEVDIKILRLLQGNAKLQIKEIAELVHMSETPVGRRIKLMEQEGVIERYVTVVNLDQVGLTTRVLVLVKLRSQARELMSAFASFAERFAEVQCCLEIAGDYDFQLQLVLPGIKAYEDFLAGHLGAFDGIEKLQTFFVLRDHKLATALPIV